MPGVAVKGRDRAGGVQLEQAHDWFVLETNESEPGDPIVTVGDRVAPHGTDAPHTSAPEMVEGEPWFLVDDTPVSRAEHAASCGHRTTGRYWFQLESEEDGFRPYRTNPSDLCNIEHIPWIMRAQGWHVAATLMDNWFERPASRNASQAQDYTTVTMDFILGFEDVYARYKDLTNPAKWPFPTTQGEITTQQRICIRLKKDGHLATAPAAFDYLSMRPHIQKEKGLQVDKLEIRKLLPPLDDLGAALGEFELFLAVSGDVEPLGDDTFRVTIRRTGVFAEDSYDFEGISVGPFQFKHLPLGDWNADTNTVNDLSDGICLAYDADFNRWRDATIAAGDGRGGDIMIYTELLVEELDPPVVFTCNG